MRSAPSHRRGRGIAPLLAAALLLFLVPGGASADDGRTKARESKVRSRDSGGDRGSSSRGSSHRARDDERSRSVATKPAERRAPERHDDRGSERRERYESERRDERHDRDVQARPPVKPQVTPRSGSHDARPEVRYEPRRDGDRRESDHKWDDRGRGYYRDHDRGDRGTRWHHPRYHTYRSYVRQHRYGHPGSYYRHRWPGYYRDVWGYDHDPYHCHHDHFGHGSSWFGFRDFVVPSVLVRVDHYRDYYYGRYWHDHHGHHHVIYRFPTWDDGDYYYRPYAYCDGHLYDRGYFTVEGPRFGFSLSVGF